MTQPTKPFKVYQASAGSGKTYTIVKEYLALCLKNEASTANYSHILAITFTNKAANEMKEKIRVQLDAIVNSNPSTEPKGMEADLIKELNIDRNTLKHNAELLFYNIIHNYSNFCVSTIDAFFQKVARTFAKDLNLPSQFNVSIDEDEVAYAITDRMGEQLGNANPFLTKILEDYCEMKFEAESKPMVADNIHAFVKKLFSEDTFQKNEQNLFITEDAYKETLAFLHKEFSTFESMCNRFVEQFDQFVADNNLTNNDFKGVSRSPCLSLVEKIRNKRFEMLTKTQMSLMQGDYTWYSHPRLESLDQRFQQLVPPFMKRYHKDVGNYLFFKYQYKSLSFYVLRSKIKAEIDNYIGEEMVVHISEFNKRINDILGDFSVPFIYERLGEHFKNIFIDEFQDTSVLQWQNIIPLIDNNLANQQMNMIVGDGKQSIYRWRNGEVGQMVSLPKIYNKPMDSPVFDTMEQNFIHNFNFIELKNNYRSFSNIVNFNNAFFRFSSDQFLPEDVKNVYQGIEQQCVEKSEGLVQVELFDPEEPMEESMLHRIKELIDELLGHGFKKGDIAILVRRNKHGSLTANYLHEKGIEVISPEAILLKSSEKVQLIISTLQYLIHNDNEATIANVLFHWNVIHTPGFDGNLSQVFSKVKEIAQGNATLEEQLQLEPHQLQSLLAHAYSLYDLCSALARAFMLNTIGDAFLNFLLDVVYQWQSADEHGIGRFLEYWEKKKNTLSILTNDTDAVKIMTIHKSKGLEFPVVIYPFVVDNIDPKQSQTFWFTAEALGFKAIPNIAKVQFRFSDKRATWSPEVATLRQQEISKSRLDQLNLHYVAFTRPKQRLYVLAQGNDNAGKNPINAFIQSQTGQTWPTVYQLGDPEHIKVEKDSDRADSTQGFFNESASGDWFNSISIDPNPSMFWMNDTHSFEPREWGLLVHQILSEVEVATDLDKALHPYLDSGIIDEPTAAMLKKTFGMLVSNPIIGEAYSPQAKVRNECELLTENNETKRPDRYAELPDKIFLIDYKTGQPDADDRQQLSEYKRILQTMVNKTIHAFLVYLKDDWIDIQPIESSNQHNTNNQLSLQL